MIYHEWIRNFEVQYEVIKFTFNKAEDTEKECMMKMFIGRQFVTRVLKFHSCQDIQFWNSNLNVHIKPHTYYYSLATFKNGSIPKTSGNLSLRKEQDSYFEFKNNYWKNIVGFDFLLDIDSPSHDTIEMAYYSAKIIKNMLDEIDCPYEKRSELKKLFPKNLREVLEELNFVLDDGVHFEGHTI